jgi:hypothetical protein
MDQSIHRFEELEKLLNALADEELDVAGRTRIGELLDGDPEACEFYLDYMALHAHLEQELGSVEPVQFLEKLPQEQIEEATTIYLATRQPPAPPVWKQPWTMAAAAAVLAGLFLISLMTGREQKRVAQEDAANATDNAVAMLRESIGAEFGGSGLQASRGDLLPKGLLKLDAGVARLQFYSGAEVILEGPVEFELLGENRASCSVGSFRASVPAMAQGFTVLSPQVEMVDLGTEFGARIDSDTATEVHVFEGEVEVYDSNTARDPKTRNLLTAGYGLQIAADGTKTDMYADNLAFISEDEVIQRMRIHASGRHDAWQRYCAANLNRNAKVMAHYPFISESTRSKTLLDTAEIGGLRNGTIIGSNWVSGRWPGKRALEFERSIDSVLIHIKERSPSITMMAWVKVERLEQRFSALLLTDGLQKGGVEWQITRAGALQLGIRRSERVTDNYPSSVVLNTRLGKWTQVAVTLDHEAREVRHFLDGKQISSRQLKSLTLPIIDRAQIGNWNAPREGDSYPVRNINGRIDEFLIVNEALSNEQILELYEIGRP